MSAKGLLQIASSSTQLWGNSRVWALGPVVQWMVGHRDTLSFFWCRCDFFLQMIFLRYWEYDILKRYRKNYTNTNFILLFLWEFWKGMAVFFSRIDSGNTHDFARREQEICADFLDTLLGVSRSQTTKQQWKKTGLSEEFHDPSDVLTVVCQDRCCANWEDSESWISFLP